MIVTRRIKIRYIGSLHVDRQGLLAIPTVYYPCLAVDLLCFSVHVYNVPYFFT